MPFKHLTDVIVTCGSVVKPFTLAINMNPTPGAAYSSNVGFGFLTVRDELPTQRRGIATLAPLGIGAGQPADVCPHGWLRE